MRAVTTAGFADRFLIISFSNAIIPDLQLTNFQFGLLTGFIFTLVYTVFGLFTGSLADRVNRPRLIAAGLFVWSGLTAATGLAGAQIGKGHNIPAASGKAVAPFAFTDDFIDIRQGRIGSLLGHLVQFHTAGFRRRLFTLKIIALVAHRWRSVHSSSAAPAPDWICCRCAAE